MHDVDLRTLEQIFAEKKSSSFFPVRCVEVKTLLAAESWFLPVSQVVAAAMQPV
jgi:hypothetical protein